jgi:alkylhydroperoxidase/carboxymuconolactone decarboxylase family protein YurZ
MSTKYKATVQLTGADGNAFAILGKVQRAMRQAGATQEELSEFFAEATAGDYDALLRTCMRYVEVI